MARSPTQRLFVLFDDEEHCLCSSVLKLSRGRGYSRSLAFSRHGRDMTPALPLIFACNLGLIRTVLILTCLPMSFAHLTTSCEG
jgi:hypothetical protein